MAWPDITTLIDDFNRASLGTNWTTGSWNGDTALSIISSTLLGAASDWSGGFYNAAIYGPDINLIFDVPTIASSPIVLFARIQNTDASPDGYKAVFNNGSDCYIASVTDGVDTQIGATYTLNVADGDKIGLEIIDNVISVRVYHSDAWGSPITRTDTSNTWPGAGYFAIEIGIDECRLDNLSGGTIGADLTINVSDSLTVSDSVTDLDIVTPGGEPDLSISITPDNPAYQVQGVRIVG